MARLFTGTSGYSYSEWKGSFYPEDLAQKGFLEYYASQLPTVEVNNTYYRFPKAEMLEGWRDTVPDAFTFAVKANIRITHRQRLKDVDQVTHDFVERVRVLGDRLGPILFQLPPYLRRDDDRLARFLEILPDGGRYTIEFRHASWFEPEVFALLEGADVALCNSEDDELETPRRATASFCYARLRRDDYDEAARASWRDWCRERVDEGRDVFLYIKHDEGGTSPLPLLAAIEGRAVNDPEADPESSE